MEQIEDDHTIKMEKKNGPKFTQMTFDIQGKTKTNSHPVLENLKNMDVENLTPMEAINKLWNLKKKMEDENE